MTLASAARRAIIFHANHRDFSRRPAAALRTARLIRAIILSIIAG